MRILVLLITGLIVTAVLVRAEDKINLKQFSEVKIRIVDEQGKPIKGAKIRCYDLETIKRREYSNYEGDPELVATDQDGWATIQYPEYIYYILQKSKLLKINDYKVNAIKLFIAHNDYVGLEQRVSVNEKKLSSIKLERGIKLRISGFFPNGKVISEELYPVLDIYDDERPHAGWQVRNGMLVSPALNEGELIFSLIHYPKNGPVYYSEVINLQLTKKSDHQMKVMLSPGISFKGQLDSSVSRPVKNGRVYYRNYLPLNEIVSMESEEINPNNILSGRSESAEIDSDGSFIIDSLPLNSRLELVVNCDGYVSQCRSGKLTRGQRVTKPQFYLIHKNQKAAVVPMEKSATCKFYVVDENGTPVSNAVVSLNPDISVPGAGRTLFGNSNLLKFHSYLNKLSTSHHWSDLEDNFSGNEFESKTDESGLAVIKNLPAGGSLPYYVVHDQYSQPEGIQVDLRKGKVTESIAILKNK